MSNLLKYQKSNVRAIYKVGARVGIQNKFQTKIKKRERKSFLQIAAALAEIISIE
jgi:hypothetical protein